jgi:hypothetical protein
MLRECLPSFFDELQKISEDLMTPAVVPETTGNGAPASPWTRRKGFKKIEKVIPKEASAKDLLRKAMTSYKSVKQRAGDAAIKTYVALPHPVKKVLTSRAVMDPSDVSGSVALRSLFGGFS